jgi:hypothetical protein
VDLARWWRDIMAGIDNPALFTWPDLASWRWGPAEGDPEPGIVIYAPRQPNMDRLTTALSQDEET